MLLRCVSSNRCCPKVKDDGSTFQDRSNANQLYSNPFLHEDPALQFGILDASVDFPDDAVNLMYDPTRSGRHEEDLDELAEETTDEKIHDVDDLPDYSPMALEHRSSPVKAPINAHRIGGHFLPMSSEIKTASGAPIPSGLGSRARYASAPATSRLNPSRTGRPGMLPSSPAPATPRGLGVHQIPHDFASPSPPSSYPSAYLNSSPLLGSPAAPAPPAPPPRSLTSRVGSGVGMAPGQPMPTPLPPSTSFEAHVAASPPAPPYPSTLTGSPGGGFARVGEAPGASRTHQTEALEAGAASIAAILQCVAQAKELPSQQRPNSEKWQQRFHNKTGQWAEARIR